MLNEHTLLDIRRIVSSTFTRFCPQLISNACADMLLQEIADKRPHLSKGQVVRGINELTLKLPSKRKEILEHFLPCSIVSYSGESISNVGFYYQLEDPIGFDIIDNLLWDLDLSFGISVDWEIRYNELRRGFWITSDGEYFGYGVSSLVAFCLGCSWVDAFFEVARILGVHFDGQISNR